MQEADGGTKGKADGQNTSWVQNQTRVSLAICRLRKAARERKTEPFTSLLHHIDADLLRMSFAAIKRNAAPGVDGVTWKDYADYWLPKPLIRHPWPSARFAVKHARWELYALVGPVRICAGAGRNDRPYRDHPPVIFASLAGASCVGSRKWLYPTYKRASDMAHVTLIGNLRQFTGGETAMTVTASSVRQLLRELGTRFPALEPHLAQGLAVAIDGQIYQDALFQEIGPDAEVQLLPQIAGG